ncbi:MAG: GntR family transcriptional regulator [Oscillospiraceae bacterium]|nr:GntR family transcriptional regulator [Oscillospiraceae bacterium]
MVHLDYRDSRPIYTQIADSFRTQIRAGVLAEGDKLPSVRELASELTINPNTIQRAYRELETEGWIASVSGKGSFVCGPVKETSPDLAPLWAQLDAAAEKLLEAGVSRQTLLQYLKQGGDTDA